MATRRAAQTNVNVTDFGSGEGEAAAVAAWERQLAVDEGEELIQPEAKGGQEPPQQDPPEGEPDDDLVDFLDEDEPNEGQSDEGEEDDEGEEGEGDDEELDEDEPDEDDEPTGQLDPNAKVKVKVDGQELEVTLRELQDGYSRTQDYTQKTQELANQRKALAQEQQEVQSQKQQWSNYLSSMEAALKTVMGDRTPEQWAELERKDRISYLEERHKHQNLQERLNAVQQEQQRMAQEHQQQYQAQLKAVAEQEKERLFEKLPAWRDTPEAAKKDRQLMLDYGAKIGFSQQEIDSLIDHRAVLVLRDAARYAALQARRDAGANKVRTKPSSKPLKPGNPKRQNSKASKLQKSSQRLAKSNSVDAAADYFGNILDLED